MECILCTVDQLRELRKDSRIPEDIQDRYEEIIDQLLIALGATKQQREFYWTLAIPEKKKLGFSEKFYIFSYLEEKKI